MSWPRSGSRDPARVRREIFLDITDPVLTYMRRRRRRRRRRSGRMVGRKQEAGDG